jgi:hypothetical protein
VVGILVILPGNAYCWCIKVSNPPLGLLYGYPWVQRCWAFVVVLLNIILYWGNSLCRYLVDLDAVSLVSCMAIIEGGVGLFVNACSPGRAVLSAPQFHDSMLVAGFVYGVFHGCRMGCSCMGLGVVKFGRGWRHFRVSIASFSGLYGNFCFRVSMFGRFVVIKEYISFCMLSSGLVICGFSR